LKTEVILKVSISRFQNFRSEMENSFIQLHPWSSTSGEWSQTALTGSWSKLTKKKKN